MVLAELRTSLILPLQTPPWAVQGCGGWGGDSGREGWPWFSRSMELGWGCDPSLGCHMMGTVTFPLCFHTSLAGGRGVGTHHAVTYEVISQTTLGLSCQKISLWGAATCLEPAPLSCPWALWVFYSNPGKRRGGAAPASAPQDPLPRST